MTEPEYPKQSRSKQDTGTWSDATLRALAARRKNYSDAEKARLEKSWAEDDYIKRLGLWEGP